MFRAGVMADETAADNSCPENPDGKCNVESEATKSANQAMFDKIDDLYSKERERQVWRFAVPCTALDPPPARAPQ